MNFILIPILLASTHSYSAPAKAPTHQHSQQEYESLEKTNPEKAAQRVVKNLVMPMIKTMKHGGLDGPTRVMISSHDGCMTYPCLKEFSHILKKAGYEIDAQKKGKEDLTHLYYLVTISRANRSPASE